MLLLTGCAQSRSSMATAIRSRPACFRAIRASELRYSTSFWALKVKGLIRTINRRRWKDELCDPGQP